MKYIEKDLIEACLRKERVGQKALYSLLLPVLKPIASRYLRNNQYILDVLQESFVYIFKNIHQFDASRGNFRAWASKIVINTSLNYNSRIIGINTYEMDSHKEIEVDAEIPTSQLSKKTLELLLRKMPSGNADVFNLYVIDGYDHEEISSILKISPALSRQKLSRARSWLKKSDLMKHIVIFILLILNCL